MQTLTLTLTLRQEVSVGSLAVCFLNFVFDTWHYTVNKWAHNFQINPCVGGGETDSPCGVATAMCKGQEPHRSSLTNNMRNHLIRLSKSRSENDSIGNKSHHVAAGCLETLQLAFIEEDLKLHETREMLAIAEAHMVQRQQETREAQDLLTMMRSAPRWSQTQSYINVFHENTIH